jgi:F-type H+-transporting ATPase subunit b
MSRSTHPPEANVEILRLLNIDPQMVLLQTIPFLIATGGLYLIIFKPMLKMLAERERNISGFRSEADLMQEEVSSKLQELEQQLAEARAEGQAERSKLRQEALAAEKELLLAARNKTEEMLETAREAIAKEKDIAQVELRNSANELSKQVAGAILGREIGGTN